MAQSLAKSSLRSSFWNISEAVFNALSADAASRPNERVIRYTFPVHIVTNRRWGARARADQTG